MAPKAFYYFPSTSRASAEGKNLHWLRMNLCASGVANSPLSFTFENANTSRPNISTSGRYTPYMKITSFKKFFINFCQRTRWEPKARARHTLHLSHSRGAHCLLLFPRLHTSKAASGRLLSFNETFLNKSTFSALPKYFLCLKGDEIFARF